MIFRLGARNALACLTKRAAANLFRNVFRPIEHDTMIMAYLFLLALVEGD